MIGGLLLKIGFLSGGFADKKDESQPTKFGKDAEDSFAITTRT